MVQLPLEWSVGVLVVPVAVIVIALTLVKAVRDTSPDMVAPVIAYLGVISGMAITAWCTSEPWLIVAAMAFFTSDAMLGWGALRHAHAPATLRPTDRSGGRDGHLSRRPASWPGWPPADAASSTRASLTAPRTLATLRRPPHFPFAAPGGPWSDRRPDPPAPAKGELREVRPHRHRHPRRHHGDHGLLGRRRRRRGPTRLPARRPTAGVLASARRRPTASRHRSPGRGARRPARTAVVAGPARPGRVEPRRGGDGHVRPAGPGPGRRARSRGSRTPTSTSSWSAPSRTPSLPCPPARSSPRTET